MKYKELADKLRNYDKCHDGDIDAAADALYEAAWLISDLAAQIARLCIAHGKSEVISVNALRFLKEHDLLPSPLRGGAQ